MLRLDIPTEPQWLDLGSGIRFRVRPLTTAVYEAARSKARRHVFMNPDSVTDKDVLAGLMSASFAVALAAVSVEAWEGVGDKDGNPVDPTPELIEQAMSIPWLADTFVATYTRPLAALSAEGNVFAPAPNGTQATGATTAGDAETATPHAAEGSAA